MSSQAIDLMKMIAEWEVIDVDGQIAHGPQCVKFHSFRAHCVETMNINNLARMNQELQRGMDNLVKNKMNDERMISFFIARSTEIESAARLILRLKYPKPRGTDDDANKQWKEIKTKRYTELRQYFHKESF